MRPLIGLICFCGGFMKKYFDYINLLIIPTNACNLRCEYCFHNEYLTDFSNKVMNKEVLEKLFRISVPNYNHINCIWHGGEPLCAGIDFYKNALLYQKKYENIPNSVSNSIQTNMTLMTKEFASFLVENNFGISTSYDGIKNELLRHNTDLFWHGIDILKATGGKAGMIMVVSKENIDTLIESYEFFKSTKINYIMNPYCKSLDANSIQQRLQISKNEYIEGVLSFYEYWLNDSSCNIRVKYFHELLDYIVFKKKKKCNVNSCLGKWLCIRPNGDITPCNRYFPNEYSLGNVMEYSDISEAFESTGFKMLVSQAILRREKCKDCSIFDYCAGGCNNMALVYGGVENNNHEMCDANKAIYKYIESSYKDLFRRYEAGENIVINPYYMRYLETCE